MRALDKRAVYIIQYVMLDEKNKSKQVDVVATNPHHGRFLPLDREQRRITTR